MTGTLYVVAAASGSGKTSLVKALLEREADLALSVSYTSRPPRPGEVDGQHYHFVSRQVFEHMVDGDQVVVAADPRALFDETLMHRQLEAFSRMAGISPVGLQSFGTRTAKVGQQIKHLAAPAAHVERAGPARQQRADPCESCERCASRAQHMVRARFEDALVVLPIVVCIPGVEFGARRRRVDEDEPAVLAEVVDQWMPVAVTLGRGQAPLTRRQRAMDRGIQDGSPFVSLPCRHCRRAQAVRRRWAAGGSCAELRRARAGREAA